MLYSGPVRSARRQRFMPVLPPSAPGQGHRPAVPPRWARALDILSLLLLLLAVIVAEWGGFRERVGSVRVALTSPVRLLLAALAVAAVRHALVLRPPIYAYLPGLARARLGAAPARAAW